MHALIFPSMSLRFRRIWIYLVLRNTQANVNQYDEEKMVVTQRMLSPLSTHCLFIICCAYLVPFAMHGRRRGRWVFSWACCWKKKLMSSLCFFGLELTCSSLVYHIRRMRPASWLFTPHPHHSPISLPLFYLLLHSWHHLISCDVFANSWKIDSTRFNRIRFVFFR